MTQGEISYNLNSLCKRAPDQGDAPIGYRGMKKHNVIFRDSSMVEQLPVKELVPGSSPGRGADRKRTPTGGVFVSANATRARTVFDVRLLTQ